LGNELIIGRIVFQIMFLIVLMYLVHRSLVIGLSFVEYYVIASFLVKTEKKTVIFIQW